MPSALHRLSALLDGPDPWPDELAGRVVMPVSATAAEIAEMRASIAEAVRLGYEAAVREAQTAA